MTDEITFRRSKLNYVIAQVNAPLDASGHLTGEFVARRIKAESTLMPPSEVTYMDVALSQIVSVAAR